MLLELIISFSNRLLNLLRVLRIEVDWLLLIEEKLLSILFFLRLFFCLIESLLYVLGPGPCEIVLSNRCSLVLLAKKPVPFFELI